MSFNEVMGIIKGTALVEKKEKIYVGFKKYGQELVPVYNKKGEIVSDVEILRTVDSLG